jgi:hypothetical protein
MSSSSFDLLQDALLQYSVRIEDGDEGRDLKSLKMDDIDFVEALQLIEGVISAKIKKRSLNASTTIDDVVVLIEQARGNAR